MAKMQFDKTNLPLNEQDIAEIDDASIVDMPDEGIKGGEVRHDAIDEPEKPVSMVDYLWKHRS